MSYAYRTTEIGRGATPTGELLQVNTIAGKALPKGDASDTGAGTTDTAAAAQRVGWSSSDNRFEAVARLDLPARIKRGSRVVSAVMNFVFAESSFPSAVVPASAVVEVWAVRRALSATFTGLSWTNWFTASAWDELGIKFGTGSDTDPTYLGSFEVTQADVTLQSGTSAVVRKQIPMRAEWERLLAFDEPLQFAFKARWSKPGAANSYIVPSQPSGQASVEHTWFLLAYKQPLEIYGDAAGIPNLADLKDTASASLDQHLYLGTPPRGAAGSVKRFWARNEITSAQAAVVVQSGRTQVSPVDNSGVAGTGRCRYVRGYDTASGQQTPSGRWRIPFTAVSTYDVKLTPEGSTAEVSVATGKSSLSDQVIVYNGVNALLIPANAFTGTFAAADVVAFETRGDLHTTAQPLSSLDSVRLAPHAAGDRLTQDTSRANVATYTTTQQLYRHDTSVIANSGGVTGPVATVTDGGTFTHVKVSDPEQFVVDSWAVLANFNAADESVGTPGTNPGVRLERVRIKAVYNLAHATYPGQVRLYEAVSSPTDFDGTSILTTGLWLGKLAAPDQGFLASAASVSSDVITLDGLLAASSGTIALLDPTTGTTETRTITSYLGAGQYRLNAPPSFAYPVGSIVSFPGETGSAAPFYVYAQPAAGVARGRKLGFVAAAAFPLT